MSLYVIVDTFKKHYMVLLINLRDVHAQFCILDKLGKYKEWKVNEKEEEDKKG